MIQVLVVEDSRITRDAIESQIAKSERYAIVEMRHSHKMNLKRYTRSHV